MSAVIFFIAATMAVAGAIGVITVRNPFYAVLALVSHLLALAALFLLLEAQFVAAAQVVIYAGAVMVLYVFVVAYVGGEQSPGLAESTGALRILAPIFAGVLFVELAVATLGSGLKAIDTHGVKLGAGYGSPGQIGELFLTRFLLPFELASILLLVAAVGAVALARRRRGLDLADEPVDPDAYRTARPVYTGTMAEAVGDRSFATEDEEEERETPTPAGHGGGW